jgi:predicted DNA-binding transcriptional regulator AlpA
MNLVKMKDLLKQMRVSRAHVYNLIRDRHFPQQMHLGGRGAWWDVAEVEQWLMASKIEERKAA